MDSIIESQRTYKLPLPEEKSRLNIIIEHNHQNDFIGEKYKALIKDSTINDYNGKMNNSYNEAENESSCMALPPLKKIGNENNIKISKFIQAKRRQNAIKNEYSCETIKKKWKNSLFRENLVKIGKAKIFKKSLADKIKKKKNI